MTSKIDALLVEDSGSDAQLVEAIIGASDWGQPHLDHAVRLDQALQMIGANTYDVVLLDLHLPDGHGVSLIRSVKQLAPQMAVVVLTGLQDQATATAALQEGAQDYVVKSETFSVERLAKLGYVDAGNSLVQRIRYAIERAHLTTTLQADQERHALALQGADEAIWDWDLRRDRIFYSRPWKRLLGLRDNHIGDTPAAWLSRIYPADRKPFEAGLKNYLDRRQPGSLANAAVNAPAPFQWEYRMRHADGHYLWVCTRGIARWNPAGHPIRMTGTQTNITLRKVKEESSQARKEVAQKALHAVSIGLLSLLANIHLKEGRFEPAQPLLVGALEMRKQLLGPRHPDVIFNLYNLAVAYDNHGAYGQAKILFEEALALFEQVFGKHHQHTKTIRFRIFLLNQMNESLGL
ncbi:MAG: response regulator [Cyanobacteria bacterium P01_A01_bin.105]